ncbi:hypothetical protein DSO57_1025194 [Entomophthora muscae]|uniref:Uncharacterized protein n=1 Tax=Entomophthora muscae TaxID=34485 RepID=A0ACC2UN91_9FUNG|nr:hypothetical protein DSO57_1025194 [Entomophthora muscae]
MPSQTSLFNLPDDNSQDFTPEKMASFQKEGKGLRESTWNPHNCKPTSQPQQQHPETKSYRDIKKTSYLWAGQPGIMRVGTNNARSLCNWDTSAQKIHHLKKTNMDLMIITKCQLNNNTIPPSIDYDPKNYPYARQIGLKSFWSKHVAVVAFSPHIDISLIVVLSDECILVVEAVDTRTDLKLRVVGVYLPPNPTSNNQWDFLDSLVLPKYTVVIGDFNTWTDPFRDTFPTRTKIHSRSTRMLFFMTEKGLVFTLDNEAEGPVTLTQWEFGPRGELVNGSRLDFILVIGLLAEITSRSNTNVSPISNHMQVDVVDCKKKPRPREWSIRPTTLRDPEWRLQLSIILTQLIKVLDLCPHMSPAQRWEEIKEVIKKESKKYEKEKIKSIFKEKLRSEKEMKDLMEKRHEMPEKIWFDEYSKTHNKIRKEKGGCKDKSQCNILFPMHDGYLITQGTGPS